MGEKAVSDALIEAEVEHIITSASLLETRLAPILAKNAQIKSVVVAPHENSAQQIAYKAPEGAAHTVYPYEKVYSSGRASNLPRPELPKGIA